MKVKLWDVDGFVGFEIFCDEHDEPIEVHSLEFEDKTLITPNSRHDFVRESCDDEDCNILMHNGNVVNFDVDVNGNNQECIVNIGPDTDWHIVVGTDYITESSMWKQN